MKLEEILKDDKKKPLHDCSHFFRKKIVEKNQISSQILMDLIRSIDSFAPYRSIGTKKQPFLKEKIENYA